MEFYFIPQNLDIDQQITTNPPVEIQNFSKNKMIKILSIINTITAVNKDLKYENGFVPVYSVSLQKQVHNYRQYLDYLLRIKVIDTDNHYIVGSKKSDNDAKAIGYKFCQPYNSKLKTIIGHETFTARHYEANPAFALRMRLKFSFLFDCYNENLKMDRNLSMDFIHADYNRKVANPALCDKKKIRQLFRSWELIDGEELYKRKDPLEQFNSAYINIERISRGIFLPRIDNNVFRLHSSVTNARSELRKAMTYRGENLVSIDIKNSQPYLSQGILTESFWNNTNTNRLTFKKLPNNPISKYFKGNKQALDSYVMLANKALNQAGPDLQQYIDLVNRGKLYWYLEHKMSEMLGVKIKEPKQVKEVVFQMLFTDNRYITQPDASPKRLFKQLFPSVYEPLSSIKKPEKSLLPCLLQRIESYLVLEKVCGRIAKERKEVPLITIHDSIATTEENEVYVHTVIQEVMEQYIGSAPALKVERWLPSEMKFSNGDRFINKETIKVA